MLGVDRHSGAMPTHRPSASTEDVEEERAFLQARVTLFWKVMLSAELEALVLACLGK